MDQQWDTYTPSPLFPDTVDVGSDVTLYPEMIHPPRAAVDVGAHSTYPVSIYPALPASLNPVGLQPASSMLQQILVGRRETPTNYVDGIPASVRQASSVSFASVTGSSLDRHGPGNNLQFNDLRTAVDRNPSRSLPTAGAVLQKKEKSRRRKPAKTVRYIAQSNATGRNANPIAKPLLHPETFNKEAASTIDTVAGGKAPVDGESLAQSAESSEGNSRAKTDHCANTSEKPRRRLFCQKCCLPFTSYQVYLKHLVFTHIYTIRGNLYALFAPSQPQMVTCDGGSSASNAQGNPIQGKAPLLPIRNQVGAIALRCQVSGSEPGCAPERKSSTDANEMESAPKAHQDAKAEVTPHVKKVVVNYVPLGKESDRENFLEATHLSPTGNQMGVVPSKFQRHGPADEHDDEKDVRFTSNMRQEGKTERTSEQKNQDKEPEMELTLHTHEEGEAEMTQHFQKVVVEYVNSEQEKEIENFVETVQPPLKKEPATSMPLMNQALEDKAVETLEQINQDDEQEMVFESNAQGENKAETNQHFEKVVVEYVNSDMGNASENLLRTIQTKVNQAEIVPSTVQMHEHTAEDSPEQKSQNGENEMESVADTYREESAGVNKYVEKGVDECVYLEKGIEKRNLFKTLKPVWKGSQMGVVSSTVHVAQECHGQKWEDEEKEMKPVSNSPKEEKMDVNQCVHDGAVGLAPLETPSECRDPQTSLVPKMDAHCLSGDPDTSLVPKNDILCPSKIPETSLVAESNVVCSSTCSEILIPKNNVLSSSKKPETSPKPKSNALCSDILTLIKLTYPKDVVAWLEHASCFCELCQFTSNLEALVPHMKSHTVEPECDICGRTFASFSSLSTHRVLHTGAKPHRCNICNKSFSQLASLASHLRVHSDEKPFECEVCAGRFRTKKTLAVHMRMHTGEEPYVCHHCGKGFKQAHSLNVHVRIHTGERPYMCKECGATFADPKTLHNHKALHSPTKSFNCSICAKVFRQRAGLACHMQTHSNLKPYPCQLCGKRFKSSSTLKNHERLHSEEKAYVCPLCPNAFKQRAGLASHMKTHI